MIYIAIILLIIFVVIILPILAIALYQNYKIGLQPSYDAQKTVLNYEIIGSGKSKLVLLHGLTGSLNYWKRDLENITKTHTILLIDLLGFGDSPKPKCDYSLAKQIIAIELILKKEGFCDGKTIIGGHSMGAMISLALLDKQPTWFQSGIFISIPVYKNALEFRAIMATHSFADRMSTSKFSRYICMIHPIFMSHAFKPNNLTEDVFQDVQKHHWQSYYYSLTELILKTNLFEIADKINDKKVLFMHGTEDKTAPLENALNLANIFKNKKIITVNEGDHQFFLKEADVVWESIQNFSLVESQSQKSRIND